VGQEECPLLPTEDLLLFRINSKRIKKDHSHWKQGHSNSLLLLMSNERINWERYFEEIRMADIGQVNMEEMVRKYGEEEVIRLMNKIMENNATMLKLQKQIAELQVMEEEKKRRQIEIRRREEERTREQEETDRWMEECKKRNEREREEKEE